MFAHYNTIAVYTDGSVDSPASDGRGVAGCAFAVPTGDGVTFRGELTALKGVHPPRVAELTAIRNYLRCLSSVVSALPPTRPDNVVLVNTDCLDSRDEVSLQQGNGPDPCNPRVQAVENHALVGEIDGQIASLRGLRVFVTIQWIPRESAPGNCKADAMARKGMTIARMRAGTGGLPWSDCFYEKKSVVSRRQVGCIESLHSAQYLHSHYMPLIRVAWLARSYGGKTPLYASQLSCLRILLAAGQQVAK